MCCLAQAPNGWQLEAITGHGGLPWMAMASHWQPWRAIAKHARCMVEAKLIGLFFAIVLKSANTPLVLSPHLIHHSLSCKQHVFYRFEAGFWLETHKIG